MKIQGILHSSRSRAAINAAVDRLSAAIRNGGDAMAAFEGLGYIQIRAALDRLTGTDRNLLREYVAAHEITGPIARAIVD